MIYDVEMFIKDESWNIVVKMSQFLENTTHRVRAPEFFQFLYFWKKYKDSTRCLGAQVHGDNSFFPKKMRFSFADNFFKERECCAIHGVCKRSLINFYWRRISGFFWTMWMIWALFFLVKIDWRNAQLVFTKTSSFWIPNF